MKEFNCMDGDMLRPRFVDGLRTVANRVTTLNLLPFGLDTSGLRNVHLREILCTFHHFPHLRAPSTSYYIEERELENIQGRTRENWEQSRGYGSHPSHPDSLATVRDDIVSQDVSTSSGIAPDKLVLGPSVSRRVCLLMRLRDLECIRFNLENKPHSSVQDLFWIDPRPPHQEQQPASIKDRLAYPPQVRQKDKDFWAWYRYLPPRASSGDSNVPVALRHEEKRRDGSLITVKYIEDLLDWKVDWSDNMTAIAARTNCSVDSVATTFTAASGHQILPIWPKLHLFCIDHPRHTRYRGNDERFKTIEEFMAKVRPHVNFQICEPLANQYHLTIL
ncbi:MAG: hypothetical protein J3R72DRAFT_527286 [Linnemannia gamsii]|nr:MAG: hypothetical protein J3R72DRAFT_527286 [Linnemannia gamsii]